MTITHLVFFTISLLFSLAFLDKSPDIIKELAILTSNLISGYLGYLMRDLKK